jgi:NitT/TauT family transport system permease protein
MSTTSKSWSARAEDVALPVAAAALLLAAWWIGVVASGTKIFPSPPAVFAGFLELERKGVLVRYLLDSLFRVGVGYGLAVLLGIPLGLLMGWYAAVNELLNMVMQMLRPISPIAWIPIAIVLFGVSNAAPIFLVFLAAFFPVVVSTTTGVKAVPPMYMRAGANFGLTTTQLLWRVVLPSALPQILTGLRISLGVAWLVLVAAEMVAVDSGLGYLVIDARNAGKRYDLVVAAMILIGITGLLLDVIMRRTERVPAVRWGFRTDSR